MKAIINCAVTDAYVGTGRDIEVEVEQGGVAVRPKGYGDCESENGHGTPVFIEFRAGVPYVVVWADINDPEPTAVICLAGADEKLRTPTT